MDKIQSEYWSKEKAVAAVERFVEKNGRFPVAKEMNSKNGLPSYGVFKGKVGISLFQYGKQHHAELVKPSGPGRRNIWNKEKSVSAVEEFIEKNGRFPVAKEMNPKNGLPSCLAFEKNIGISLFQYGKQHHAELVKASGPGRRHLWNKEKAVAAIEQFIMKNGRFPIAKEMHPKNGLPSYMTFEKKVGISLFQYGKQNHAELVKLRGRGRRNLWNKEKAVAAIEQFITKNGRFPMAKEMNTENGLPSYMTFKKQAGVPISEYGKRYYPGLMERSAERQLCRRSSPREWTKEKIIAALKHFVEQNDRLPSIREYGSKNNLPAYNTFCKNAKTTLNDYLNEYFLGRVNQVPESKEDETEAIEQDEPSLGMTMAAYQ